MRFPVRVRVVFGLAAVVALTLGVMNEVATGPARGGIFLAALFLAIGAISPSPKIAGWWLAIATTALGVGLVSSLIYGLGMSNLVDRLIGGDEVRRYLLVWPPVLVVSTFAGGLVGTRSFRQALVTSLGAVLAGGLIGAVALPFEPADGLPTRLLLGVALGYFVIRTWIRRPQSLRTKVS